MKKLKIMILACSICLASVAQIRQDAAKKRQQNKSCKEKQRMVI